MNDGRTPSGFGARSVVSLFSGPGGLDCGLEAAGWQVLAQVEMSHDAAETLRLRAAEKNVDVNILEARIEDLNPRSLRDSLGLLPGELGLLAGGPPCQPFTTHGRRQAANDPRVSTLFPSYFRFVEEFSPRTILIENVDGILSAALSHRPLAQRGLSFPPLRPDEEKGSFLRWLLERLRGLGYAVAWGVAEAADYGVPQLRQRAILVGTAGRDPCFLPPPKFGIRGQPPHHTLRQGLAGVSRNSPSQPLSARKKAILGRIPPGGNWRSLPEEVRRKTMRGAFLAEGGKSGWWRRLAWDEPAPTILGMPDHSSTALVHPDLLRCLSVAECAALQSFPRTFRFAGTPRSQYQQIGNAVPPLLALAIGEHLLRFEGGERIPPTLPVWRRESANRRVGTHGWVSPLRSDKPYRILTKTREDHVWAGSAAASVCPNRALAPVPHPQVRKRPPTLRSGRRLQRASPA